MCARPRIKAVANGSPEGLSKAWAACGDSVESRVSDGSAPFCAIYRAFVKVVGRERHVVFPSSKSILEGKWWVSYTYDEVLG